MQSTKTVSITLPQDLLSRAQRLAEQERRTINELFREALNRYMGDDPQWNSLLERTYAAGAALGVHSEQDVERLSDEYRRDRQR